MRLSTWALAMAIFFPAVAAAQGPMIDHAGAGCVVARKFPVLEARISPADRVARARVYFRAAGRLHWYFVEMTGRDGVFAGTLPRPRKGTARIEYYIEATDTSAASSRTADQASPVVGSAAECSRLPVMAGVAGEPTIAVGAPSGAPVVPAGFEANGVVAAGAGAAGAAVAATVAAGAGGGGIGTAALVVGGVVVAGGAAAAVALGGGGGEDGSVGNGPDQPSQCGTVSIVDRTATTLTVAWSGGQPTDGKYFVDGGPVSAGTQCTVFAHGLPSAVVQGLSFIIRGLAPGTTYAIHVHPAGTPCAQCDGGYNITDSVGAVVGVTTGP